MIALRRSLLGLAALGGFVGCASVEPAPDGSFEIRAGEELRLSNAAVAIQRAFHLRRSERAQRAVRKRFDELMSLRAVHTIPRALRHMQHVLLTLTLTLTLTRCAPSSAPSAACNTSCSSTSSTRSPCASS